MKKSARLTFNFIVTADERRMIDELSAADNIAAADVMRQALRAHYDRRKRQRAARLAREDEKTRSE